MSVQLNHTIVFSRNKTEAAQFLCDVLDLGKPTAFGPFLSVDTANGVTLDFYDSDRPIVPAHYAFLVTEREFDQIFARIIERNVVFWADPIHAYPHAINHDDGGRGFYFEDPSGHNLEVITRQYGSGPLSES